MADRGGLTPYEPENAGLARKLCLLGATNRELADWFEVDLGTIDDWLATRPGFAAAVRRGREVAEAAVTRRLFERAMGCSYEATEFVKVKGEPVPVRRTVNLPPDTEACIAWLRDCRPEGGSGRTGWEHDEAEQVERLGEADGRAEDRAGEQHAAGLPRTAARAQGSGHNGQNGQNSPASFKLLNPNTFSPGILAMPGMDEIGQNGQNSLLPVPRRGSEMAILQASAPNAYNARNSTALSTSLIHNAFPPVISGQSAWPVIVRNGLKFPPGFVMQKVHGLRDRARLARS